MRRKNQNPNRQDGHQETDSVNARSKEHDNRRDPAPTLADSLSDEEETLPLLKKVCEPGDPIMMGTDKAGPRSRPAPLSIVQSPSQHSRKFERDILDYELRTRLLAGLEEIVRTSLSKAFEEAVRDLERSLQDVLIEPIESCLDENVTTLLDDWFSDK